jgi:hypothetical protein
MDNYERETWAKFGKATAWTLGIATGLGAVYGIGTIIYNQGRNSGAEQAKETAKEESRTREQSLRSEYDSKLKQANEAKDQLAKNNNAALDKLAQDGRLIPEDSCLRYTLAENKDENNVDEIVSGKNCGQLEARLSWYGTDPQKRTLQTFTASLGDHKAIFKPKTNYESATIDLQERKKAEWIPYQKK